MVKQNDSDSGKLRDPKAGRNAAQLRPGADTAFEFQEKLREHELSLLKVSRDLDQEILDRLTESNYQLEQSFKLASSALKFLPNESSIIVNRISETLTTWELLMRRWYKFKEAKTFSKQDEYVFSSILGEADNSANRMDIEEDRIIDNVLDVIRVSRARQSELAGSLAELESQKSMIKSIGSESAMLLSELQLSWKKIEEFIAVEVLQLKEFDGKSLPDSVSKENVQIQVKRGEEIAEKLESIAEHVSSERTRSATSSTVDEINSFSEDWLNKFALSFLKGGADEDDSNENQLSNGQRHVVYKILEAISKNEPRMFISMPAGSGKTRIASVIARTLHQTKWSQDKQISRLPRILFLLPNKMLADYLVTVFPTTWKARIIKITPDSINQTGIASFVFEAARDPRNVKAGNIFITYVDGPGEIGAICEGLGEDFFDLIIVDDCEQLFDSHSEKIQILHHFGSAIQLGFTMYEKTEIEDGPYKSLENYFGEPLYIGRGVDNVAVEFQKTFGEPLPKTWYLVRRKWKSEQTKIGNLTANVLEVLKDGQHRKTLEIMTAGWPVPPEALYNSSIQAYFRELRPRITKVLRREYRERNNIENPPGKTYSSRYFDNAHDAIKDAVVRGWIVDIRPFHVMIDLDQNLPWTHIELCITPGRVGNAQARWWTSPMQIDGKWGLTHLQQAKDKFSEKDIELELNILVPAWIAAKFAEGLTPLHLAALTNSADTARLLNQEGAKVEAGSKVRDTDSTKETIKAMIADGLGARGIELVDCAFAAASDKTELHPDNKDPHYETAGKDILTQISTQEKNLRNHWAHGNKLTPLVDDNQRQQLQEMFSVDERMLPLLAVDLGLIYKSGSKFEFTNGGKVAITGNDRFNRLFSVEIDRTKGSNRPIGIVDTMKTKKESDYYNHAHKWLDNNVKLKEEILSIINLYIAETLGPITETDGTARFSRIPEQKKLPSGYRSRFNDYINHICAKRAEIIGHFGY